VVQTCSRRCANAAATCAGFVETFATSCFDTVSTVCDACLDVLPSASQLAVRGKLERIGMSLKGLKALLLAKQPGWVQALFVLLLLAAGAAKYRAVQRGRQPQPPRAARAGAGAAEAAAEPVNQQQFAKGATL